MSADRVPYSISAEGLARYISGAVISGFAQLSGEAQGARDMDDELGETVRWLMSELKIEEKWSESV